MSWLILGVILGVIVGAVFAVVLTLRAIAYIIVTHL